MPASERLVPTGSTEPVINLSGYRFVMLDNLPLLQHDMQAAFDAIGLKGTILLAEEGINVALSGFHQQTSEARQWFDSDPRFANLWLKESTSDFLPFAKLKVRVRHEIITFQPDRAAKQHAPKRPTAPTLSPAALKRWLDEDRRFTLLDTRNRYEIDAGTFDSAKHLEIDHFREFIDAVDASLERGELDPSEPVVTFCTGGIRCEKAAPWLLERGFNEVYQVEGGVLNYFSACGGNHWRGDCFVFDDRVTIDTALVPTGARLCTVCHRAVPPNEDCCAVPSLDYS